jgi:predicted nucleic acid-binding protein
VLVDYLRGRPKAIHYLEGLTHAPVLSAMTIAELYAGVREGKERQALDLLVDVWEILPFSLDIARRGGLYRRDYAQIGVDLADALIAATAVEHKATLVTLNKKHFPMVTKIEVPYAAG